MTSLSTLTSSSTLNLLSSASGTTSATRSRVPGYVQTAAKALGMSSSDVMSALQGGQSLSDLAKTQGVSEDDLVAALKAGAPSKAHGASTSDSDADSRIEALAETGGVAGPGGVRGPGGIRGPGGHGGPPPSGDDDASSRSRGTTGVLSGTLTSAQTSTLSALSSLLGTDSDTLLTKLTSGTSLSDLLSQSGVDMTSLANKLEDGLMVDTSA